MTKFMFNRVTKCLLIINCLFPNLLFKMATASSKFAAVRDNPEMASLADFTRREFR